MPELEKQLESSPEGLSQTEAQKRLTKYGPNEIEEKKANPFLKFLTYLWGPIPWMIEAAVMLSAVAQHWPDFGIILLLLVANAVVGFWEEHQAGNAIAALKAKLAIKARVKRDGKWTSPEARELVPGDVIRVRLGDIVPADARLLAGDPIEVDQSVLTGESLPATRNPGEAVFSGSIIRQGEIDAMVFATGAGTYFGKTAQLVQEALTVSHFQRAVLKIGNYLIILAVTLVAVIISVALFRGDPILTTLQFALVLTVAAIPVAMPTVLSVTMAVGARLLAKKEAIVTRLAAIEELAGVDMLCSDKTGTLTQNRLTLGDPFSVNDVPALKKADCGIAVSGATDVARAAASIVLMTPGLSVIIFAAGGVGHAAGGDADRGLWGVYDTPRLGLGAARVGLCAGVVPRDRPRETARVSGVRSNCRASIGHGTGRCDTAVHQGSLRHQVEPLGDRVAPLSMASGAELYEQRDRQDGRVV
jgi:magnesium-transporting ATPase (P-type)